MISCFIFVALPCEAKPFITNLNLKKVQNTPHPFAIYKHDDIVLTVSGVGKIAMAAAVAYTLATFKSINKPVLLNIGIAGHPSAPLGQLWCANKIVDVESERCFYPQAMVKLSYSSTTIYTASKPNLEYPENGLYEMEASSFYETAAYFSSAELIHVLKVVSDNKIDAIETINAKKVSHWLAASVEKTEETIRALQVLALNVTQSDPHNFERLIERYYFNVNNRYQLKKQLSRWDVLTDARTLDFSAQNFKDAKAVLYWLQCQLELQIFRL
ncbi:MAG: hypothetical protein KAH08_03580 [Methylococcales bacterium]|nr:hypothetical protein [Methylococcales bacterium]